MQKPKPHLSISQLNMLSRCGEQYRRRYISREIIPPGIAMLVGSAVDRAVTRNLEERLNGRELLPVDAVAEIASAGYVARLDTTDVLLTEDEESIGIDAARGRGQDKSVRLARLHAIELAPAIEPTHLQRKVEVDLTGYDYSLLGFIDIQERGAIRDTKTASKTPAADTADKDDQLTIYALMAQVIDGAIPERLCLDYLIDTEQPKTKILHTARTVEDFHPLLRRVEVATRALAAGVFIPARETDWVCSPRWCGYHATCIYTKKSKRPKN